MHEVHDVKRCIAACRKAWLFHLQTIGKQAYEFLEAPRGKVWGAVHAVGGGSDGPLPGFQSAFDAHGGRQTTEVGTAPGVPCPLQCSHIAKASCLEDRRITNMLPSGFHCVYRSWKT